MANLSKPVKAAAFIGRYKRYKAGTKQVIEWLARTADRVGDLASCLDCLRNNPKANGGKLYKTDIETIRIKTHELKKLAEVIANSDPPVGVPRDLLRVLEDVIAGRQACAGWYASQAIDDVTELATQNESHAHFIAVLKQVQEILRTAECMEPSRPIPAGKKAVTTSNAPSNIFNLLDLDESLEQCSDLEDSPVRRPAQKSKKPKKKGNTTTASKGKQSRESSAITVDEPSKDDPPPPYTTSSFPDAVFQMEQSDESDAFALWCHLADLNDIRMSLKETWTEYAEGKITLDIAGTVTETGFGMMKQTHEEFVAIKPRFIAHDGMSLFLGLNMAFNNNVVYTFSKNPLAKAAEVQSKTKQADLVCVAAALHLRMFREACQMSLRDALKYKLPFSSHPYPVNLIGNRPQTEFEAQAFSFLPEITALVPGKRGFSRLKEHKHYRTHFTEALTDLVQLKSEPKEPPVWVVVATQTCIDIQDIIDIACGPTTLRQSAALFEHIVDEHNLLHQQPGAASTPEKKKLNHTAGLWKSIECAITPGDLGSAALAASFNDRLFFPGLHALPSFAGELNHSMKLRLHDSGTTIANDCGAVMTMAHLYKAARKYGIVTHSWQDLETVTSNHSKKRPLVTKTKPTADAYAMVRHFLLDMGVSAPDPLPDKIPAATFNAAPQALKKSIDASDSELIAAMLQHCYSDDQGDSKSSKTGKLEAVLSGLAGKLKGSVDQHQRRFAPVDLLATLKEELIATETRLNFDYIGFSEHCQTLLSHFIDAEMATSPEPGSTVGSGPAAIYHLLKKAADAHAMSDSKIPDTLFAAGAAYLQELLSDGQSSKKFSQAAFNLSSGRLRKESRPAPALNPEKIVTEAAVQNFLTHLGPGASISSSRKTIEIYDPTGSVEKLDWIFNTPSMAPVTGAMMPDGIAKDIHIVIAETITDMNDLTEGFSRPRLNMIHDDLWNDPRRGDDYIDRGEALKMEQKRRKQVGLEPR